ncbi:MAG: CPBP family intramembrane metalloprotease [Deltaproteobacteria bacterium]|nr:CPBP family intramembrane metalloprotease [Deltaproteobacteria bacterium]
MRDVEQAAAGEAKSPAPGGSQTRPGRRELGEILVIFAGVTAACAVLWQLRRAVPFVAQNLHALIAAIFLYLPTALVLRRKEDFGVYGLTTRPVGRGLLFFLGAVFATFPPFVAGFYAYHRLVCARAAAGLAVPEVYRRLCTHFVSRFAAARRTLPANFGQLALAQVLVVALPEEYFFRGYLQTRLERVFPPRRRVLGGGLGLALVFASVLFALGHVLVDFNPLRLAVFFPSLLFGWMRGASGSILAGVLYHAACNLISELLHHAFF